MKILLIEDDKNLCEMLCFQLEKEHHTVEVCMDGRDGLDLVLQDAYDLILLDRMLPTMNGLLVLQKARSKGISTPVIMITALGELYDRVEGLDCVIQFGSVETFRTVLKREISLCLTGKSL